MPERVGWLHWLAAAVVCGVAWWLALVYFQYETLAVTGACAALSLAALTIGKPLLVKTWFRVMMAVPFAISLGACAVGLAWALALIV